MKDFNYYAPTQVAFGRKAEQATGRLVKQYGGTKVLVHYGGKSAERSGLETFGISSPIKPKWTLASPWEPCSPSRQQVAK